MRAADYEPTPDGATSFFYFLRAMNPNTRVKCSNLSTSAGHLADRYRELLDFAADVEEERDRWHHIALELLDKAGA